MLTDEITKLNRSSTIGFLAALVVIAAIGMYRWILAGHNANLQAAQQNESVVDEFIRKNQFVGNTIELKKKKLEELRIQSDGLRSKVLATGDAEESFGNLQAIAKDARCVIRSLNAIGGQQGRRDEQTQSGEGVVAKRAVLNVIGSYGSIMKMISGLQKSDKKIWLDSLKMQTIEGGSDQLKCEMTVTIYTVSRKETTANE